MIDNHPQPGLLRLFRTSWKGPDLAASGRVAAEAKARRARAASRAESRRTPATKQDQAKSSPTHGEKC